MDINPSDGTDDVDREDEELRRYVLEHAYEIPLLVMEVDP